jgi:uncharacterized membrane protein YhaH (DUF805 family)
MEWMLMPLRRYADFRGRSRRREYWMFTLFIILVALVLAVPAAILGGFDEQGSGIGLIPLFIIGIFSIAIFIPSIAVQVRRFHDQDRTGWLVLLGLIPYVGGLIVLVFMCLPGTRGDNRFGRDPKENIADAFV